MLSTKRDIVIVRLGDAGEHIVAKRTRAALIRPFRLDHSGAWQIGCQSSVLKGVDRAPESSSRGNQLCVCLIQHQLYIIPRDLILQSGVRGFHLLLQLANLTLELLLLG